MHAYVCVLIHNSPLKSQFRRSKNVSSQGFRVRVLEASERVGGRTYSVPRWPSSYNLVDEPS